jgi:hypothetical protein
MSPRIRIVSVVLVVSLQLAGIMRPAAGSTVISSDQRPFHFLTWASCVRDGLGDDIDVDGTMHVVARSTTDGAMIELNLRGIGIGQESGTTYTASLAAKFQGQDGAVQISSAHDSLLLLGRETGVKIPVHTSIHVTRWPDGHVTADLSSFRTTCR